MHRRVFIRQSGLTGAGIYFSGIRSTRKNVDGQFRMLRNNVGIFTEKGGTIGYVLDQEGIAVIDAQFPDTAGHLIAGLKERSKAPIRYLLNTHHHADHTAGNIAFKGLVEHLYSHENSLTNQRAVAEKQNSLDKQYLPDQTFAKDFRLKVGKEVIKGHYFGAGHTNGDAFYHFENANIIHTGDLMFNKRHPYVDRSAGANMANWMKYLDVLQNAGNKETIYIFGHSLNPGEETGGADDLKKFQDYLGKVLAFAKQEREKGVAKEEFIKNTAIPGVTAWTGEGIERPLTAAYEEVSEAK